MHPRRFFEENDWSMLFFEILKVLRSSQCSEVSVDGCKSRTVVVKILESS